MIKAVLWVLGIGVISYLHLKKVTSGQAAKVIKKDVTVYLGIMLCTCVIGALMILGIRPPTPVLPLEMVFEKIGKAVLKQ